jgi:hypothetical protein
MNLHAFIPPLSCHPSSTLKSMVFGLMVLICHLTDAKETQCLQISQYFDRFAARGHSCTLLKTLFKASYLRFASQPYFTTGKRKHPLMEQHRQFLHLPFNPGDPRSKHIQQIFRAVFLNDAPLHARDKTPLTLLSLTICYHKQQTLGALVNPSNILKTKGMTPKQFFDTVP